MKLSIPIVILMAFFISSFQSCATYKTVVPSQQRLIVEPVESLEGEKCISIPRIYSGVSYSFCVMINKIRLKSDHADCRESAF